MSNNSSVTLRNAQVTDMLAIWWWNNAPAIRAVSLRTTSIPFSEHSSWFMGHLVDSDSTLFVVESDGVSAGIVRFRRQRSIATVSISLSAACRGRGLGRRALAAACDAHLREFPRLPIEAWILKGNEQSRRCFTAVGFTERDRRRTAGRCFVVLRYRSTTKERQ